MKKKTILYIVRYQVDEGFNLKAKFDGQIKAFENMGMSVYYIGFDRKYKYLLHCNKMKKIGKTHFEIPAYFHTLFYHDMYRLAEKLMKQKQWDFVYWRSAPCFPSTLFLTKAIKKNGAKLIYEYQTFPITREKQSNLLREYYLKFSDLLQKKVDSLVDCFVLIGEDAGGTYSGKPAVNIENGIDPEIMKQRQFTPDPDAIHLLALASMSYWHGYDRLIKSLAAYDGEQNIVIHMVGGNDGGSLEEWRKLAADLGISDKVIFHGKLSGEPLDQMFDICDIGINSLGMYRKGFSVTCELKTREYTSRGLPFVCSVDDPGLASIDQTYWLKVPNDDSIPDMKGIAAFALKMREDKESTEKLRSYAKKYMTWESQYKKVFDTIGRIEK